MNSYSFFTHFDKSKKFNPFCIKTKKTESAQKCDKKDINNEKSNPFCIKNLFSDEKTFEMKILK